MSYTYYLCVVVMFVIISCVNTKHTLTLKLNNTSLINVKVGNNILSLAIDPSTNFNYIFDKNVNKYSNKHYNKEESATIRISNAQLTASNVYGTFTGNLAIDEFQLCEDIFNIDSPSSSSSSSCRTVKLCYILVKEDSDGYIPSNIDGIIGLAGDKEYNMFYKQMSLIEQLIEDKIISNRIVHINYKDNRVTFGNIDNTDDDIIVNNITNIKILNNSDSKDNDEVSPILFFAPVKFGFSASGNTNSFNVDNSLITNVTFIPIYEGDHALTASVKHKDKGVKTYLDKLNVNCVEKTNKKTKVDYVLNTHQNKERFKKATALVFDNNYFVYDWINNDDSGNSSGNNNNRLNIELSSSIDEEIWNVNVNQVFKPEKMMFDYDTMQLSIINCKYCGKEKGKIDYKVICYIVFGFIVGVVMLCWCFGRYIRFRKDRASKFMKKYDLM